MEGRRGGGEEGWRGGEVDGRRRGGVEGWRGGGEERGGGVEGRRGGEVEGWRGGGERGEEDAHMSGFAVTIPRNPTGPILHCYCKHSVLCIG